MAVVKKISELTAKGSNLGTTDLLIVGVSNGVDHDLKTVTGAQVLGSAIVQTITNGDTTHASSSDALFDALALKADVSPVLPATIVDFDTTDPNTPGTVFTPDDQLNTDALYVSSVDFSQWTSDGVDYNTYTVPATAPSTEWYLASTTIDAGGNKTANIERSGEVRIISPAIARLRVGTGGGKQVINASFVGGLNYTVSSGSDYVIGTSDVKNLSIQTNYVERIGISSAGVVRLNNAYTLPTTAPTAGQVLGYSSAGVSDWVANQDLSGLMVKSNNLSDLTNTTTARTNLGLGSLATQSGTFSGTSSGTNTGDQTFLDARVQSVSSSATVTPTSTNDLVIVTAQAVGLTLANPTGTFTEGQALMIRIKDNGTARSIAFDTNYRAIGVTLPTTTVISKTLYLGIIYNSTDSKWDIIGYNIQA